MKLSYNPRIIRQLGTELITSDSIAIMELIKNSYDAESKKINLFFFSSPSDINHPEMMNPIPQKIKDILMDFGAKKIILVEDIGKGMNKKTIQNGFFQVGTDFKKVTKQNSIEIDEKIILGDKGIGRLSAQRLSSILILETTSKEDDCIHIEVIEWSKFYEDREFDSPGFDIRKNRSSSYTRLWCINSSKCVRKVNFSNFIEKIETYPKDTFGRPTGKRLDVHSLKESILSALNFLHLPFSEINSPIELHSYYNSTKLETKFNIDKIHISELVHNFTIEQSKEDLMIDLSLDIKPWFIERIHMNETGQKLYKDWIKDHKFYNMLLDKYKHRFKKSIDIQKRVSDILANDEETNFNEIDSLAKILPIHGKVFSFKRTKQYLDLAIDSAKSNNIIGDKTKIDDIRDFLNRFNGIKLYRNNFRVASLGDKDSDWLKLQQRSTTGQQFYRFELGNVIGYVQVNDPLQKYIFETSSRDQIVTNEFQKALEQILDYIFNDAFYKFTKSAVDITKDILNEEKLIPKKTAKEVKKKLDTSKKILNQTIKNIKVMNKQFEKIEKNIDLDNEKKINIVQDSFLKLKDTVVETNKYLDGSIDFLKEQNEILAVTEREKKEIEIEAYNNFKLLANGLITEVITHELHSLLSDTNKADTSKKLFSYLRDYMIEKKNYKIIKDCLTPLEQSYGGIYNKINNVNKFYSFLEKTFIYKGTIDDFENVNLSNFLDDFKEKFNKRLINNNIDLINNANNLILNVPKGSLIHLFYNLFDNSIYWIKERQRKARYDNTFVNNEKDFILVEKKSKNKFHYYDSGTGVLPEYENTLFHALESGKVIKQDGIKRKGRGMGLYIVKRFLESFDATIILRPEVNKYGNRYIFEITSNSLEEIKL